jgi:hypothetical protein
MKWDGFRAVVSTEGAPLRVRSRRGWNMTDLVPELSALSNAAALDGDWSPSGRTAHPTFRPGERGWVKTKNRSYRVTRWSGKARSTSGA